MRLTAICSFNVINVGVSMCFRKFCLLAAVSFFGFYAAKGQNDQLSVYTNWMYYGDMSNTLYKRLCETAFQQLRHRAEIIDNLQRDSDYLVYQKDVRKKIKEMVGDFPEKTPLNPVVTDVIHKDHYRVEKLYFESLPQYFVTAALFIPENKTGRIPAILYCSGHSADGFRGNTYQHEILNLVMKGFAVLAFDPIGQGERVQYFDDQGEMVFSPTKEHSYPGTQSFLTGRSPAYYFIWDGIRAVDYLTSRTDIIDTSRIGITGRSGGGTQSTFISAMDDRIFASVTANYITSYDKLLRSIGPTDAEQTLMYALYNRIDFPDFLIARAPKPVLIVSTTRDFFSIQGARDTYHETERFYQACGQPGNVALVEDDTIHASTLKNREAEYAFFQKYLNNPGSARDVKVDMLAKKDLQVTVDGSVFKKLGSKTLFDLNRSFLADRLGEKRKKKFNDLVRFNDSIRSQVISLSGYVRPEADVYSIFSGRFRRGNYSVEKYLIRGSGDYFIPVLWFRPEKSNHQAVVLLDDQGKANAATVTGLADELANKGFEVVLPDLIGIGELGGGFKRGSAFIQDTPLNVWYLSVLTKKSVTALRMEEIVILNRFIKTQTKEKSKVSAIAVGTLCSELLHVSAVDSLFGKIVLIEPLISFRGLVHEKSYQTKFVMSAVPGAAAKYDFVDLMKLIRPTTNVLSINPVEASGEFVDSKTLDEAYSVFFRKNNKTPDPFRFILKKAYTPDIHAFLD